MNFKEPLPNPDYILEPGDIFLSAGQTLIYKVVNHPCCRLYRDEDKPGTIEPNGNESSWYYTGCPKKGWRRSGPNFPSYQVVLIDKLTLEELPTEISLRWKPTKVNLELALSIVSAKCSEYLTSPSVEIQAAIPDEVLETISLSGEITRLAQLNQDRYISPIPCKI